MIENPIILVVFDRYAASVWQSMKITMS